MSLEQLKSKLAKKKTWVKTRYEYYEQKNRKIDPSPVIQDKEKWAYNATLGWCTHSVDILSNKLRLDGFDNDELLMWNIFQRNNKDVLFTSAIRSALISACSFVYISADEEGNARLQVIDGENATGNIDPITNLLKEGYAILDTDENGVVITEAYFTPEYTQIIQNGQQDTVIKNDAGYPLLVPIIYRPDAKRPFGQSRISKAAMDIVDKARFCITRAEVTAEFGTIPQKYILGLDPSAEFDSVKNAYKSFLAIDKDDNGDRPVVGQFQQATLTPHLEQFKLYKEDFDKMMGIDTPEALEQEAITAQESLGISFLNVGFVASCLENGQKMNRSRIYMTEPVWKPVYHIDNSAISAFGDGVLKINQAFPNAIGTKEIRRLTGLPVGGDDNE